MEGQMGSRKTGGAGVNLLLVMVGLALGAAGALYAVRHVNTQPPATKAEQPAAPGGGQAAGPPPEVAVVTIQPERVTISTDLPGRTVPYLVAEVRPQVNGIVQKRLFKEGADVQAGDVLTQIDPAPFQAALDSAAANLAAAQKAADRARAAEKASQATVAQQQATLELAQTNRRRIESLVQDAAVSISERDKVVTEAKVAEAGLRSAQAQLNSSAEAVAEAEAGIEQAKAALETARINLEYTRITAPISGRIGKSDVTVGSLATAHQAVAFTTIQQIAPIYVDVTQSRANLLSLREKIAKGLIKSVGADQ
jgi:membrane fusion protein (multidrug efflux system)